MAKGLIPKRFRSLRKMMTKFAIANRNQALLTDNYANPNMSYTLGQRMRGAAYSAIEQSTLGQMGQLGQAIMWKRRGDSKAFKRAISTTFSRATVGQMGMFGQAVSAELSKKFGTWDDNPDIIDEINNIPKHRKPGQAIDIPDLLKGLENTARNLDRRFKMIKKGVDDISKGFKDFDKRVKKMEDVSGENITKTAEEVYTKLKSELGNDNTKLSDVIQKYDSINSRVVENESKFAHFENRLEFIQNELNRLKLKKSKDDDDDNVSVNQKAYNQNIADSLGLGKLGQSALGVGVSSILSRVGMQAIMNTPIGKALSIGAGALTLGGAGAMAYNMMPSGGGSSNGGDGGGGSNTEGSGDVIPQKYTGTLNDINPNQLAYIKGLGQTESGFDRTEAYSDALNKARNNSNVKRYGYDLGADHGYYQNNQMDVNDLRKTLIKEGMPEDQAHEISRHLNGGGPGGKSTIEQQTLAMHHRLRTKYPKQYEALKSGDPAAFEAARKKMSGHWFGLRNAPQKARREWAKAGQGKEGIFPQIKWEEQTASTESDQKVPSTKEMIGNMKQAAIPGLVMPGISMSKPQEYTTKKGEVVQKQMEKAEIRKRPISDKLHNILERVSAETGVIPEIWSGGQAGKYDRHDHGPRTGSTRHDHGNAADLDFYTMENGKRRLLKTSNPEDRAKIAEFLTKSASYGVTGVGGGSKGYMGANRFHLGFGNEAVWKSPKWVSDAFWQGRKNQIDISSLPPILQNLKPKMSRTVQEATNMGDIPTGQIATDTLSQSLTADMVNKVKTETIAKPVENIAGNGAINTRFEKMPVRQEAESLVPKEAMAPAEAPSMMDVAKTREGGEGGYQGEVQDMGGKTEEDGTIVHDRGGGKSLTNPNNFNPESAMPSPGDSGYGDYKQCFI